MGPNFAGTLLAQRSSVLWRPPATQRWSISTVATAVQPVDSVHGESSFGSKTHTSFEERVTLALLPSKSSLSGQLNLQECPAFIIVDPISAALDSGPATMSW